MWFSLSPETSCLPFYVVLGSETDVTNSDVWALREKQILVEKPAERLHLPLSPPLGLVHKVERNHTHIEDAHDL
jgi:hypothetical protein